MSRMVDGEKYLDLAEITFYCGITKTQFWEFVEKGVLPKPIYPEWWGNPYWKEKTIYEFEEGLNKQ